MKLPVLEVKLLAYNICEHSMALLPPSSLSVLHGAAAFWLLISYTIRKLINTNGNIKEIFLSVNF
jgi:hypothetical protein